jgi:hypothetical protein
VEHSIGAVFWTWRDFDGKRKVAIGDLLEFSHLPRGKYVILPVGPVGQDLTTHVMCPCGTFLTSGHSKCSPSLLVVPPCGDFLVMVLISEFLRLNQKFHQHLCGGLVTNPARGSHKDTGAGCLLPREYGQWACVAQELDPGSPYLLCWAALMCMDGTCCTNQRKLLRALGWVVPFRWRVGSSDAVENPVSYFSFLGSASFFPLARL